MSKKESIGEYVSISKLIPWDDNPRENEHAIDDVAKSIKRFGFAAPIIARAADGMVIAGHTRLLAAKKIGLKYVPVRYMDLDLNDAQLLALADNKIGEISDWDYLKLKEVIQSLKEENLSGLGWSDNELQNLLLDIKVGINNADEEWIDMPEYINEDMTSERKIIIHFKSDQDVQGFAFLIGQKITEKTKSLWHPVNEDTVCDLRNEEY